MDSAPLLTCLAADHARLRTLAVRDLAAAVPSCPGWTVTDLVRHVAEVYLHKVECIRHRRAPEQWPPDLSGEESVPLLDRAYAELVAEFDRHSPGDAAYTWHEPDQTVGFWIRRMAQETVIHRIDAELAVGEEPAPIPADLAVDGVDEVLTIFLGYLSQRWPEEFGPALKEASGRPVRVTTDGGSWLVRATAAGVHVDLGDAAAKAEAADPVATPAATVTGPPETMLRWLWARGGDDEIRLNGDSEAITELRGLLGAVTA
jgi:uncharacterized protein (TIGR03083 family)